MNLLVDGVRCRSGSLREVPCLGRFSGVGGSGLEISHHPSHSPGVVFGRSYKLDVNQ